MQSKPFFLFPLRKTVRNDIVNMLQYYITRFLEQKLQKALLFAFIFCISKVLQVIRIHPSHFHLYPSRFYYRLFKRKNQAVFRYNQRVFKFYSFSIKQEVVLYGFCRKAFSFNG